MNPNKKQLEIIDNAITGKIALPKTNEELRKLFIDLLLARDYETEEAPMIEKCKSQFIRTAMQKCDNDGWVYLSVIKSQLNRRSYFKELDKRLSIRSIDGIRHVARAMITEGLIKRNGVFVMVTNTGKDYLKKMDDL